MIFIMRNNLLLLVGKMDAGELLSVDVIDDAEFNKEKFKQVLHHIISQCGMLENVGKTVLYKLLYFSDFDFYELFEEKMTGETYRKFDYGPAPYHFANVIDELQDEGKVDVYDEDRGRYLQTRYISLKKPALDLLNGNEKELIDREMARYCHMNAKQISAYSHRDQPFKATENDEIIDYELVFYRDSMFSVREYEDD